jgi:RHS repeat-associated protein
MVTPRGNVTGGTPANFTWTYQVDNLFQRTLITDPPPLSHSASYSYDANENLRQVSDANFNKMTYVYDADNNVVNAVRGGEPGVGTTYDAAGNVQKQTDGLGHITTYGYDALNRETSVTDPLSRVTSFVRDGAGNVVQRTDAAGQNTFYTYDPADQLASALYPDGLTPNVSYTYDADGQRLTMLDGTGQTVNAWDSLYRLTDQVNGNGAHVGYGYDLKSQLTSIAYPGTTGSVSRAYDDAGRLHTVTDWLTHTTTINYDPNSNVSQILYPNTVTGTYTLDDSDRLMGISFAAGGTTLLSLTYTRDNGNRVTGDGTNTYGYGANTNWLTNYNSPSSPNYAYDGADHPTQLPGGSNQAYDNADELCWTASTSGTCGSPPTGATTYAYDNKGNRTARSAGGATTGLSYDAANRLLTYGGSASYGYDGDGRRMSRTISGATAQQTWSTAGGLPLLMQDGSTSYIAGAGGTPLEQISGSTVLYYHEDELGSVRLLTNSSGASAGTASYDPYGNPSTTGTTTPFGFAGEYTDSESGFVYLRARYYDPATAQLISHDPVAGMTHEPYTYSADDPLNEVDPSGLLQLPTGGKHPYVSSDTKTGKPVKLKGNQGYRDCNGNRWVKDPQKGEWDVQHPDGTHTNVGENGEVTHGEDNFPGASNAEASGPNIDWPTVGSYAIAAVVVAVVIVAVILAPEITIPALVGAAVFA